MTDWREENQPIMLRNCKKKRLRLRRIESGGLFLTKERFEFKLSKFFPSNLINLS